MVQSAGVIGDLVAAWRRDISTVSYSNSAAVERNTYAATASLLEYLEADDALSESANRALRATIMLCGSVNVLTPRGDGFLRQSALHALDELALTADAIDLKLRYRNVGLS